MRKAIPVEKRIAVALHCLKSGGNFDTIGALYNVGKSTVGLLLHEFCHAIVTILREQYIHLPTVDTDLNIVVNGFESRWDFKGVMGALDGTHIPIKKPEYLSEDYVNYKRWHSIHALCLVAYAYRFRFINVGAAGRNADGGVFAVSSLAQLGNDETIFPPNTDYYLIADAAFALSPWLLKLFPMSGLTKAQENFNYRLSRARMVVECAFGRLKSRWRILLKSCDLQLCNMNNVVLACAILHNMCENQRILVDKSWREKQKQSEKRFDQPPIRTNNRKDTKDGEIKRERIMNELLENIDEFNRKRQNQNDIDIEY